jgi:N-acetylglucosaminyldiphosphoundecaprenol N-acetyl-beta-D-mannosaminyltransferase
MKSQIISTDCFDVLDIGIHSVNMKTATSLLLSQIKAINKGYICFAGVHGIMEAQNDSNLRSAFSGALLVAPDGMPIVWIGHWHGFPTMQRVFGPDFMTHIMGRNDFRNYTHFFYGGDYGVAEHLRQKMTRRFPWVKIVGTCTPPFRDLTIKEEEHLTANLRELQPDIVWVGLSTPKQERFMERYLPVLDTKVMIGVGAAFLFHTGAIKDSPSWVKRFGLQWAHRLWQEPVRLSSRYMKNNPRFIFYAIRQIVKRNYCRLV